MNLIQKGELVFVRLLLPLMLGIALAILLPQTALLYYLLLATFLFFVLALSFSIWFYNKFKIYLSRWKPGIIVQAGVFVIGITLTLAENDKIRSDYFAKFNNEALVVSISSEPRLAGDIVRFEAQVKQGLSDNKFIPQTGLLGVALKLENSKNEYQYGDELLITNGYTEVGPPNNPYEFNYKNYLENHGIAHQIFINETAIRVLAKSKGDFIKSYALALRQKMILKYSKYILDKEAASVASTLILGYKAELSREVLSAYSKTGTMHVLSVSGMHVGIVFFILNRLLWFMSRNKKLRIIRATVIISLIWFYALITGFSPSVCRAALMLSIYVLGKAVSRSSNSYNLVAASAVLLLIYNPYFLFDVGFQLSYLAVLGLIYFYPKIYHIFYIKNWFGDQVWSYIALSCAAQLATFPLGMYYFHQFPVYFLISNLFIVLPVILIMYLGIVFLFIPWNIILKPLGWLLGQSITLMDNGLFYIEKLPLASYSSYHNFLYYLLMYVIITGIMLAFQFKSKGMFYTSLAMVLVFFTYQSASAIVLINTRQITFYSLRKNTAFDFFDGRKAVVYSDLDSADKALAFSVHSAVQAKTSDNRYYKLTDKLQTQALYYDGNFFTFRNWELLVWDKGFNENRYANKIKVNAVLLSGNPKVTISELVKTVKFKMLLIDGANPEHKIKNWVDEAADLSLSFYVLKENPAYQVNLD